MSGETQRASETMSLSGRDKTGRSCKYAIYRHMWAGEGMTIRKHPDIRTSNFGIGIITTDSALFRPTDIYKRFEVRQGEHGNLHSLVAGSKRVQEQEKRHTNTDVAENIHSAGTSVGIP